MLSILGFLIILGPLVVFHEFGHYIFARLFNVKAEAFSVGFGPRIFSKQWGETEWRLSAIPLGGYVKLLGEEADRELTAEEAARALPRQAAWKRFFIFAGGPIFNFLLAALVFMAILAIGEPQMASVIGRVVPGSAAAKAGLQSGDRVVSINGKPVRKFEEVLGLISENPGRTLDFVVRRAQANAELHVGVTPAAQDGFSVYGESVHVGEVEGLVPMARANVLGVSDPASLAGKSGLRTGDKLISWSGQPVTSWEEVDARHEALTPGQTAELGFEAPGGRKVQLQVVRQAGKSLAASTGIHSSELFVEKPVEKSPAEASGVRPGDRLVGVGATEVRSFFELRDAVQRSGEREGKVLLRWEREGQAMSALIVPNAATVKDPALGKSTQYTVGVVPQLFWAEPETLVERVLNPVTLVVKGTERMIEFSGRNLVSIGKMLKGEVSINTLGGPILIGKIAGESLSRGLIAFLSTMAVLSVGLGVLNLLPVPVLDGGHIVLLLIEAVRGKPLSVRVVELTQQVGLALILLLMVVVMRNDLARLPFFN